MEMYAKSDTRNSLISQSVIRIATDMGIESYVREIRHGYSICAGEFIIVDMADNTSVKMIISDYDGYYQQIKRNMRKWRKIMTRKDVVLAISEDVKAVDYLAMREQRDKHNKLVTRRKREDRRECFAMALLTIFFAFMIIVVMLGLGQVWEMIY